MCFEVGSAAMNCRESVCDNVPNSECCEEDGECPRCAIIEARGVACIARNCGNQIFIFKSLKNIFFMESYLFLFFLFFAFLGQVGTLVAVLTTSDQFRLQ